MTFNSPRHDVTSFVIMTFVYSKCHLLIITGHFIHAVNFILLNFLIESPLPSSIIIVNSLDPYQAQQNAGPDLDHTV